MDQPVFASLDQAARVPPETVLGLAIKNEKLEQLPDLVRTFRNLRGLNLTANGMTTLPEWLEELTALETLELRVNALDTLPPVLARLPALRALDLSYNPLKTIAPGSFIALRTLRELGLDGDPGSTLPIEAFALPLERLTLSRRQLGTLPRELFAIRTLRTLAIGANALTRLPDELAELVALESLDTSYNDLKSIPAVLAAMPALRSLELSNYSELDWSPDVLVRLTQLERLVANNRRSTTLPDAIGSLVALRELRVAESTLAALPETIGSLVALELLDVSKCKLTTLPCSFGKLTALRELDLRGNQLAELPASLAGLTSLAKLQIGENPLVELAAETLGSLTGLVSLGASSCKSLASLPDTLVALTRLEKLDVSWCPIAKLPEAIGSLDRLRELRLSSVEITELPASFARLHRLESLALSFVKLASIEPLRGLPALKSLAATQCDLTDAAMPVLGSLPALVSLDLTSNKLTRIPEELFALAHLETLDVSQTMSWDVGNLPLPASIAKLTRLRVLKLPRQIDSLPPEIAQLRALEELHASQAAIRGFPSALCELGELRKLVLTQVALGELPDAIANLARLEVLEVEHCGLTRAPDALGKLTALRTLNLKGNIVGELPESLGNLARLDVLTVSGCGLSRLPDSIGGMRVLRCLWASDNKLTTLPASFAKLVNLENLELSRNALTRLPPSLLPLRRLTSLGLTANVFSPEALTELEAFGKRQVRGYLSLDAPRKGKSRPVRPPSPDKLSPKVIAQLERLGAKLATRENAEPVTVERCGQSRVLPEAMRQLALDVEWPAGPFEAHLGGMDLVIQRLAATTSFELANEYEAIQNQAYLELGHTNHYCILLLDLDDAKPQDPSIRYLDHDSFHEVEPTSYRVSLSGFLATFRGDSIPPKPARKTTKKPKAAS